MERKHILMVDDVTANLRCAGEILKNIYRLSSAKSGKQALEIMEKDCPDLILLDIHMPEMNGYEIIRYIKAHPAYREIPVIFLTAEYGRKSELEGFRLGAADYIKKPASPEDMLSRIEKILRMAEYGKKIKACNT